MTTRLAQAGAELNTIGEFTAEITNAATSASAVISSTKAKTGTYSLRHGAQTHARGLTIPATAQIRGGFFINHNGLTGSGSTIKAVVLTLTPSSGNSHWLQWTASTGLLELFVNGSSVATVSAATGGFSTTNAWVHIGFTFKAHGSAGYFTIYLNGVAILTYSGNTTNTNSITAVTTGGATASAANSWANNMYVDDLYIDDDTGGSDSAPASPRFMWSLANGAGSNTQWTPLSGTNISNVDDPDSAAPDDDATYNYAQAANLTDTYTTTDITLPAGYSIAAVIPVVWARKTNAGVDSRLSLVAYNGSSEVGSSKALTTSYSAVWDRFETDPSAAGWTQSSFNGVEIGAKSAGSF